MEFMNTNNISDQTSIKEKTEDRYLMVLIFL